MSVNLVYIPLDSLSDRAYRTNKLTIVFIEAVEAPRVEDALTSGYARRLKVCFHDRVVCRVKFENNDIARVCCETARDVGMWTRLGTNLDSVCRNASRGGSRRYRTARCRRAGSGSRICRVS